MLIENNLLLFNTKRELTKKVISQFYNRLKIFLQIDHNTSMPSVIFTDAIKVINEDEFGEYRAIYDGNRNLIVFQANDYDTKSESFKNFSFITPEYLQSYRYIIPLSDIYHELIHHIQELHGDDTYIDIAEGTAELYAYILTGQENIDYKKEVTALWYVSKHILKLDIFGFYTLITNMIADPSYIKKYFLNKSFLKLIHKEYNDNIKLFFNNLAKNYGDLDAYPSLLKDLNKLHNFIYYKY